MVDSLPLLVVDAANVVGSVPDGWWRDRAGAAARLRDGLVVVASRGLEAGSAPAALRGGPVEVVLVVEGAARGVSGVNGVQVVSAPGSGDDAIVEVVRARRAGRPCFVATADRGLATRVRSLGALVIGPRTVRPGA
jgi:hypothetical protein